jgi:PncC family amidohydrolase
MRELLPQAERIAALLIKRRQTVAVAESSAGGLIAAALLAVPGASAYFAGGAVLYSRKAWHVLRDFDDAKFGGARPATEENAAARARIVRAQFAADWGIGETGAAGPTGGRYGNAAGTACIAIAGRIERATTVTTGSSDRVANMYAFAAAALQLLADGLEQK